VCAGTHPVAVTTVTDAVEAFTDVSRIVPSTPKALSTEVRRKVSDGRRRRQQRRGAKPESVRIDQR
jgi:hypothetical protein